MTYSEKLKVAITKGDLQTVKELLSKRLPCDAYKDGRTLLHVAAQNGRVEVVIILIQHGCSITSKDINGYTPLHVAAAQGHLEVIKILLESGAYVDEQDQCGNTGVHASAWNGYSRSLDLLIKFHANVNIVNKAGFSALHTAAQRGHNQSARNLLYAGCLTLIKNNYGETPLHTATRHGHAGVAQILISAKAKVNSKNKNSETSLHVAAMLKRNKIARMLVEGGAKKSIKNKQGETPLDVARKSNSTEIILFLENSVNNNGNKRKLSFFQLLRGRSSNKNKKSAGLQNLSEKSSVSSYRNLVSRQNQRGEGLRRSESFDEVSQERTGPSFNSLDRLRASHKSRPQEGGVNAPRRATFGQCLNYDTLRSTNRVHDNLCHDPHCRNCRDAKPGLYGSTLNCWGPQGFVEVPNYPQCCPGTAGAVILPDPRVLLDRFRDHQMRSGTSRSRPSPFQSNLPCVQEVGMDTTAHNYGAPQGLQYYRDLAGNLKQGPVGLALLPRDISAPDHGARPGHPVDGNYFEVHDMDAEIYHHEQPTHQHLSYYPHPSPHHHQHLYEDIGAHHMSNHFSDDGGWTYNEEDRRRLPGHPLGMDGRLAYYYSRPDITTNRAPTELTIIARDFQQATKLETKCKQANKSRDVHFNVAVPGDQLCAREVSGFADGESDRKMTGEWPHPRRPRRCMSDETLSTVVGSSDARKKTAPGKSFYTRLAIGRVEKNCRKDDAAKDGERWRAGEIMGSISAATKNGKPKKKPCKSKVLNGDGDYLSSQTSSSYDDDLASRSRSHLRHVDSFSSSGDDDDDAFQKNNLATGSPQFVPKIRAEDPSRTNTNYFPVEVLEASPGKKPSPVRSNTPTRGVSGSRQGEGTVSMPSDSTSSVEEGRSGHPDGCDGFNWTGTRSNDSMSINSAPRPSLALSPVVSTSTTPSILKWAKSPDRGVVTSTPNNRLPDGESTGHSNFSQDQESHFDMNDISQSLPGPQGPASASQGSVLSSNRGDKSAFDISRVTSV